MVRTGRGYVSIEVHSDDDDIHTKMIMMMFNVRIIANCIIALEHFSTKYLWPCFILIFVLQDPILFVVDGVKLGKLTKIQQLNECSFEEFSPNCERNFEHQRNPQQQIKIENESKEYHSNTTI